MITDRLYDILVELERDSTLRRETEVARSLVDAILDGAWTRASLRLDTLHHLGDLRLEDGAPTEDVARLVAAGHRALAEAHAEAAVRVEVIP